MTKDNANIIGKQIQRALENSHMTQYKLGVKMGFKDGSYISRWISGDRTPGTKSLQSLAEIFNVPVEFFLTDGLTKTQEDIKLPALISVIKHELDKAQQRYELNVKEQRILEVPVMVIDTTIPKPFLMPTGRTIQILDTELATLDLKSVKVKFAVEVVTDLGNEFDIRIGDFVILQPDPPQIDGALYLITYQGIMLYRNIVWKPPTLIDGREIKTPFKEKYLEMSGMILRIDNSRAPKFYQPKL